MADFGITYTAQELDILINEIQQDTIADTSLACLSCWVCQNKGNFEFAREHIRELRVDSNYNTSRISNKAIRALVEETQHFRDGYVYPSDEERIDPGEDEVTEDEDDNNISKTNKSKAVGLVEFLKSGPELPVDKQLDISQPLVSPPAKSWKSKFNLKASKSSTPLKSTFGIRSYKSSTSMKSLASHRSPAASKSQLTIVLPVPTIPSYVTRSTTASNSTDASKSPTVLKSPISLHTPSTTPSASRSMAASRSIGASGSTAASISIVPLEPLAELESRGSPRVTRPPKIRPRRLELDSPTRPRSSSYTAANTSTPAPSARSAGIAFPPRLTSLFSPSIPLSTQEYPPNTPDRPAPLRPTPRSCSTPVATEAQTARSVVSEEQTDSSPYPRPSTASSEDAFHYDRTFRFAQPTGSNTGSVFEDEPTETTNSPRSPEEAMDNLEASMQRIFGDNTSDAVDVSWFPAVPTATVLDPETLRSTYQSVNQAYIAHTLERTRLRGAQLPVLNVRALSSFERAWRRVNHQLLVAIYGRNDVELSEEEFAAVDRIALELGEGVGQSARYEWVGALFQNVNG